MKISTKGRYGLRLMLDLAIHYGEGPIPLKEIAERQNISEKYLEQIIMQLNRSGMVHSTRGSQGGYSLANLPEKITVGMVLRVMEGSLAPVDCLTGNAPACGRQESCITLHVWKKLMTAIEDAVDNITLDDLIKEYRDQQIPIDFCI